MLHQDIALLGCGRQQCLNCALALPSLVMIVSAAPCRRLRLSAPPKPGGLGGARPSAVRPTGKPKAGWQQLSSTHEVG